MKTSKIIFISLLSVMALLILITMVDMRLNGRRNSEVQKDFKMNRQPLHSFKVLYLNDCMNVSLVQNDSAYIDVTYLKDSIVTRVNYSIREDTLRISDFEKKIHRNVSVRINSTDSLDQILLKNSDLSIERFGSGKLSLNLDHSSVWMDHEKGEKHTLSILDVVAKNQSNFNTGEFKVDSVGIVLQYSRADLRISAKKMSGSLSDSSRIDARQPQEISLKKDATSKINVNDY